MTTTKTLPENNGTTENTMVKPNDKATLIETDHLKNGHTTDNKQPLTEASIDKKPSTEEPKEKPAIIVEPSANNKK